MMKAADPSRRPQKHFLKLDAGEETALGPIFLNIGAGVEGQDVGIVYRHRADGVRQGEAVTRWRRGSKCFKMGAALGGASLSGNRGRERENTHLFWLLQVIAFLFFCPLVSNKLRAAGEQGLKNHVNPRKPPLVDEERQLLSLV